MVPAPLATAQGDLARTSEGPPGVPDGRMPWRLKSDRNPRCRREVCRFEGGQLVPLARAPDPPRGSGPLR